VLGEPRTQRDRSPSNNDYFLRRANEELAAVDRASSAEAARAHFELANRYLAIIENGSLVLGAPARH
jgi:hypothetical protein